MSTSLTPGEQHIEVNGVRLWYRVSGSGGRPPLMVQAPGWGLGSPYLQDGLAPLHDSFTVIYHDPRGNGKSERPRDSSVLNVAEMVEDLEALRRHLGLSSFALLGHSHGGFAAMRYAARYGQHLSHLVLVATQLGMPEVNADLERNLPRLAQDPALAAPAAAWAEVPSLASDAQFASLWQKLLPLYFHSQEKHAAAAGSLQLPDPSLATFGAVFGSDADFPVRDDLHRIQVPTLVVAGRHDFITSPRQEEAIYQGIPNSRLVVLEQSGHFPWLEEPEPFFDAVRRFLLE